MPTTRLLAITVTVATAGGCGDNSDKPADAPPADAALPMPVAIAVSGDFNVTGVMSRLDITQLTLNQNVGPTGAVAGDPVIRHIGDRLYVVNRFGGNSITQLDARTLALVEQYGIGANSNPQDVAVVGTTLYVPVLGGTGMAKVDTTTGAVTPLDLGTPLGDPDGNPDCLSAYAVDSKVYVACGLLDGFFTPRGPGKVAVIDTANGDAVTAVTLPFENPQNFFVRAPEASMLGGDLLIGLTPSYTNYTTGCVARVSTGATPTASCVADLGNADLGGFVTHMDVAYDGELLWLAVGTLDSSFSNPTGVLMGYDLADAVLWTAPISTPGQLVVDVATCPDGSVVVVDRTMNAAGMRVYKDSMERTTAVQPIGLPPAFGNNVVCYDQNAPSTPRM